MQFRRHNGRAGIHIKQVVLEAPGSSENFNKVNKLAAKLDKYGLRGTLGLSLAQVKIFGA